MNMFKEVIKHWEDIVSILENAELRTRGIVTEVFQYRDIVTGDWNKIPLGIKDCAFCTIYYDDDYDLTCIGCPVYKHTDFKKCENTPYASLLSCLQAKDYKLAKQAAREELEFLKQLELEQITPSCYN